MPPPSILAAGTLVRGAGRGAWTHTHQEPFLLWSRISILRTQCSCSCHSKILEKVLCLPSSSSTHMLYASVFICTYTVYSYVHTHISQTHKLQYTHDVTYIHRPTIHTSSYAHIYAPMHIFTHFLSLSPDPLIIHTLLHVLTLIPTHLHSYMNTHTHVFTHTNIYSHIHTHVQHTYTLSNTLSHTSSLRS